MGLLPESPRTLLPGVDNATHPSSERASSWKGQKKISACLVELARLWLHEDADPELWRTGICLAAIAWNLTLLPRPERGREVEQMLSGAGELTGVDSDFLGFILEGLMERKLQLYPDDPRLVINWQVRTTRRRIHIIAAAALPDGASSG
jgi:hypothetical protein